MVSSLFMMENLTRSDEVNCLAMKLLSLLMNEYILDHWNINYLLRADVT